MTKLRANDDAYTANIASLLQSVTTLVNATDVVPILLTNSKESSRTDYTIANNYATEITKGLTYNKTVSVWDISHVTEGTTTNYYSYNFFIGLLGQALSKENRYWASQIYFRSDFVTIFTNIKTTSLSKILLPNINAYSDSGMVFDRAVSNPTNMLPTNEYIEMGKISAGTKFFAEVSFRYKGKQYMKKFEFPITSEQNSILDDALAVKLVDKLNATYTAEGRAEAEKLSGEHGVLTQNTSFLALEPGAEVTPCYECPDWNNWQPWWRFDNSELVFSKGMTTEGDMLNMSQPVNNTTNTNTTSATSTNYFNAGYAAGKQEAEAKCGSSSDDAYNIGYQKGYSDANVALPTSSVSEDAKLSVYPNPFVNELTITVETNTSVLVEIIDATGAVVESFTVTKTITLNAQNSKIASLVSGVYIVKTNIDGVCTKMGIIKK
jgi:hypothetical protein